jgi:hypothetical protein
VKCNVFVLLLISVISKSGKRYVKGEKINTLTVKLKKISKKIKEPNKMAPLKCLLVFEINMVVCI